MRGLSIHVEMAPLMCLQMADSLILGITGSPATVAREMVPMHLTTLTAKDGNAGVTGEGV